MPPKITDNDEYKEVVLSQDEIDAVRKKAGLEFERKEKEKLKEVLLKKFEQEEAVKRAAASGAACNEDEIEFTLNLAPSVPFIKIDGREFRHGTPYKAKRGVFATISDMSYKAWRHEMEWKDGDYFGRGLQMFAGKSPIGTNIISVNGAAF